MAGSEYPIKGIMSHLPSMMRPWQLNSDKIMLFGHPGWNRYDASQGVVKQYSKFVKRFLEKVPELFKGKQVDESFLKVQAPKLYIAASNQHSILLEELTNDTTFKLAKRLRIPTIVSVSCEPDGQGYKTKEGVGFIDYLNWHIGNDANFYVLPTTPKGGIVQGFDGKTVRDAALFHRTDKGRQIFGDLFSKYDRQVIVTGGDIDACLASTVFFFGDQERMKFLDAHISAKEDTESNLNEEDTKKAIELTKLLFASTTEPRARRELITLLKHNYSTPRKSRKGIYQDIVDSMHTIGATR